MFTRISTPLRHTHLRIPIQPHPSITLPSFSSHTSSDEKPGKDQKPQDDEPALGNKIKRTFKTLDGDVREFDNFIQVRPHVSYRVDGMFLDEKDSTPATRTAMVGAITFLTHFGVLAPIITPPLDIDIIGWSVAVAAVNMATYYKWCEPFEETLKPMTENQIKENQFAHPENRIVSELDVFSNNKACQETIDKLSDPARWVFLSSITHLRRVKYGEGMVNAFTPSIGASLGVRAVTSSIVMYSYGGNWGDALLLLPFMLAFGHMMVTPFVYPLGWFMSKWICMAQDGKVGTVNR